MLFMRNALRLIHSFWLPAMLLYFLDHGTVAGTIGFPDLWSKVIDPFIMLPAKVITYAWIWGLILEILSGENTTARFENFVINVQKGWRLTLIPLFGPRLLHAGLFFATGIEILPVGFITATLGIGLTCWGAWLFVSIKYSKITSTALKNFPFSFATIIKTAFILAFSTGLYFVNAMLPHTPFIEPLTSLLSIQCGILAFALIADEILKANPAVTRPFTSTKTMILVNLPGGGLLMQAISPLLRQYPPFFAVLRALAPAGYRFIEYNRTPFWHRRFFQSDALVAISSFTSNAADAYKLAKEFRKHGSKVVLGGPHVTFFPDEALLFADSVVIGPAESVWADVIHDYERGTLKPVYRGHCAQPEMTRLHEYLLAAPVPVAADFLQINRGCKFNCYFCASHAILNGARVEKSLDDILELIRKVSQKAKAITFIDDNIYANPAYAKKFFEALIPLKITWAAQASIDIAHQDYILKLLYKAGCRSLLIGYEIDGDSMEKASGGKLALAKDYYKLTQKIRKTGIMVKGHFIFGFPNDSWRSLAHTWWFCVKLAPFSLGFSFLTPLPGTRFFDDIKQKDAFINLNWRKFDLSHQVWQHPRLGAPWLLRKGFLFILGFFSLTASTLGRIILLLLLLRQILIFTCFN